MERRSMIFMLLLGCPRPVPAHLALPPSSAAKAEASSLDSLPAILDHMLRGDPLARSPLLLQPQVFDTVAGTEPLKTFVAAVKELERTATPPRDHLGRLANADGQLSTPLARGYLWRRVETLLASSAERKEIVSLLTPLRTADSDAALPLDPLAFLKDDDALRRYGERWVLESWLHGPDLPLKAVEASLKAPQFSHLATSPTGRLLLSRHRVGDSTAGLALLERATFTSLTRAAADRDTEQAAWADLKLELRDELSTDKVEVELLSRSFDALLPAAQDPAAAGGALLTIAALRWLEACPDEPCDGLDRTELITAARRYGGQADAMARVWQVIVLKDALDTMDAGHDTVLFPVAARRMVDALQGTGAGPFDAALLMRPRPEPGTWLSLARGTGGDDTAVDWGTARNSLASHVVEVVDEALVLHNNTPFTPLLKRVRSRAAR